MYFLQWYFNCCWSKEYWHEVYFSTLHRLAAPDTITYVLLSQVLQSLKCWQISVFFSCFLRVVCCPYSKNIKTMKFGQLPSLDGACEEALWIGELLFECLDASLFLLYGWFMLLGTAVPSRSALQSTNLVCAQTPARPEHPRGHCQYIWIRITLKNK